MPPGASPISGVPPPKHSQFGQPGGNTPGYKKGRPNVTALFKNELLRQIQAEPRLLSQGVRSLLEQISDAESKKQVTAAQFVRDTLGEMPARRVEAEVTERRQTVEIHEEQDTQEQDDAEGER